ncbi:MAG: hydantoinase B/oxoprolinase family protein, partial [Alphaproteobacteria bacterium]|nr:hydantoinase B/oxoprolinase family protein [Alphaproteobacteria bacterium]
GDDIRSGDIFIVNDPYLGGTHLNDVAIYAPRSAAGTSTLFPAVRAHWGDIGGAVAGSISGQSRHIFEEGLRIPPLRLCSGDDFNDEAVRLILHNVRDPEERRGDLMAMIGTARVATRRLAELEAKYGAEVVASVSATLLHRADERMRAAIRAWPDGDYHYENYLDNSGADGEPLRISLRLEVRGDTIRCDFTGTSPQGNGPINGSLANTASGCFIVLKSFLDPASPINGGCFRALSVHAPEGTFLNAAFPAPAGGSGEIRRTIEATVAAIVAQVAPERASGDVKGAANHCYISGQAAHGRPGFLLYEYASGGGGAVRGRDGENMIRTYNEGDFNSVQPIETLELRCPLLVESSQLRLDSGGAGEWRGGLGLERRIRVERSRSVLSVLTDRVVIPPYGVCAGGSGAGNRFTIMRGDAEIEPSAIPGKVTALPLEAGDVVVCRSAGGGGYGEALDRAPDAVRRDVEQGLVSVDEAISSYGVVLLGAGVDRDATLRLRAAMRAERRALVVAAVAADMHDGPRRILRITGETASALGAADGDIVELVPARGAPLRTFLMIDDAAMAGVAELGPVACRMLGVADGARIAARRIRSPYRHSRPAGSGRPAAAVR